MKNIVLVKLSQSEYAKTEAPAFSDYTPDFIYFRIDMPISYEIKGKIKHGPEVGKGFCVSRTHRNGIEAEGVFETSPVKKIESQEDNTIKIHTENSIYLMKEI